jgi:hypothetical protein
VIDKESLKIKLLEQVLIEKVYQLFPNPLERLGAQKAPKLAPESPQCRPGKAAKHCSKWLCGVAGAVLRPSR